jgi:hypothetical protein
MTNNEQTLKEINNIIGCGGVKVNLDEYKRIFKKYGFTIDMDTKNHLHKYYNTSNPQPYLCATTTFLGKDKKSFANVESEWYKEHVISGNRQTRKYMDFAKDRDTYFAVLESGHILTI